MERNVFEIEMKDYKAYKSQFEPTLQNKGTLLTEEEKVMLENDYFNAAYEVKETTLENSYNDLNLGNGGKGILKKIKGRTLQNLYLPKKIIFGYAEINENRFTIDTSDIGHLKVTIKEDMDNYYYVNAGSIRYIPLKPNTKYTAYASTNTGIASIVMMDMDSTHLSSDIARFNKNGVAVFTTLNTINETNVVFFYANKANKGDTIEIKDITILEGDWTNKPIPPYFEGIRSVAEEGESLVAKSCGKNLINDKDKKDIYIDGTTFMLRLSNASTSLVLENPPVGENLILEKYIGDRRAVATYNNLTNGENYIEKFGFNNKFVLTKPAKYLVCYLDSSGKDVKAQLEEGTTATQYEPYTEDKSEILLQNLRGLSDNVCDILDMESGKLTRNIGKEIYKGISTENWNFNSIITNFLIFRIQLLNSGVNGCITNIIPYSADGGDFERIATENNTLYFKINESRLTGYSDSLTDTEKVNLFKAWLQANPVTVYYQLATPIVTQLSISDNKLELYRNGHIFVEGSLISPYIDLQYTTDSQIPIFEQYMLLEYPPNVLQKSPEFAKYIFSLNSMDIKLYYWDINYFKFVDYNPEIFFSKMEFDIPNKFEDTIYIMLETTRDFISANDLKMSLAIEKIRSIVEHMPHYIANSEVANNICSPIDIEIIKAELLIAEYTKQFVISTATFTLSRYEEQYNLPINPLGITIEERRSRVKAKMRSQGAVTKQMIRNVINSWTNAEIDIIEDYVNYSVTIKFIDTVGIPSNVNDIYKAIDEIKPAHLNFIYEFKYNTVKDVRLKNWTVKELADKSKTVKQLIEEPL